MVPLSYYLLLGGILFACGVAGFLIQRNIITIFMSIELMLNGVNLSFVAFAAHWHSLSGQIFVFFVMVVAAAEAAPDPPTAGDANGTCRLNDQKLGDGPSPSAPQDLPQAPPRHLPGHPARAGEAADASAALASR